MTIRSIFKPGWVAAIIMIVVYVATAPANHSEAEDVYDFAARVEQGSFADQTGVNRVLALPAFGVAYKTAQLCGYSGRAFPFMIFVNRLLAVLSLFLFYRLLGGTVPSRSAGIEVNAPPNPSLISHQLIFSLVLAFSYGFWRYANEAETYILAGALVLGAWCLVLRGKWLWAVWLSAFGILVHLLNLIPLLLIIPLYYLLCGKWKKAVLHGVFVGGLVLLGYALCSPWIVFSELGAQHHALEGGLDLRNLTRGVIAFGQCVVSGNFLFGFEWFRELLVQLFPSRMLDEEFFMAQHMPGWIKWVGCATFVAFAVCCLWVGIQVLLRRNTALEGDGNQRTTLRSRRVYGPLTISYLTWLVLYAVAVMRTESGSPELWILGLIPFWLLVASLLPPSRILRPPFSILGLLAILLFVHNLIAGLLPVWPTSSDYHRAKGKWLLENTTTNNLILTSYEPVMIFYLNYYAAAEVIDSSGIPLEEIQARLGSARGSVYALDSFFMPLDSMKVRSPLAYDRMLTTGNVLRPDFEKNVDNEFGGIYRWKGGDEEQVTAGSGRVDNP